MSDPWKNWIPGVLSAKQLRELIKQGKISIPDNRHEHIDPSSIDLSLADDGYQMTEGSVKPYGEPYFNSVERDKLVRRLKPQSDGMYTLRARKTYLFKLRERLSHLKGADIYGQATAKSSVGRNDVLARLIVDGMDCYESFSPAGMKRSDGDMFLELTPMTYDVAVRRGTYLSQLRLFYGNPESCEIRDPLLYKALLHRDDGEDVTEGSLSVDLSPTQIADCCDVVAFRADLDTKKPAVNLWKAKNSRQRPCPYEYWKFERGNGPKRLHIKKNAFYILRSKERISVPKGIAVYCRANDETIGEMRIHYAGFVHPFFGTDEGRPFKGKEGTPLIFEVRGHDVDVNLIDDEKMARLTFYRMSLDEDWSEEYRTDYNTQVLKLSQFFRDWPKSVRVGTDGAVMPARRKAGK